MSKGKILDMGPQAQRDLHAENFRGHAGALADLGDAEIIGKLHLPCAAEAWATAHATLPEAWATAHATLPEAWAACPRIEWLLRVGAAPAHLSLSARRMLVWEVTKALRDLTAEVDPRIQVAFMPLIRDLAAWSEGLLEKTGADLLQQHQAAWTQSLMPIFAEASAAPKARAPVREITFSTWVSAFSITTAFLGWLTSIETPAAEEMEQFVNEMVFQLDAALAGKHGNAVEDYALFEKAGAEITQAHATLNTALRLLVPCPGVA